MCCKILMSKFWLREHTMNIYVRWREYLFLTLGKNKDIIIVRGFLQGLIKHKVFITEGNQKFLLCGFLLLSVINVKHFRVIVRANNIL